MRLSIIVAAGRNGEIGCQGRLPWPRLGPDVAWFRRHTLGKPVIMGRHTWVSLPERPLLGRRNVVLSRRLDGASTPIAFFGCDVFRDLDTALGALEASGAAEVVVIGGAEVYTAALPLASRLYLTRVDADFPEADVTFPLMLPPEHWQRTPNELAVATSGPYLMNFSTYERLD
jgi:dihydrofolate reductase